MVLSTPSKPKKENNKKKPLAIYDRKTDSFKNHEFTIYIVEYVVVYESGIGTE